ncbi:MAG: hypothetical protein M0Q25_02030 [Sulfurospirillaceae bacterium]|nr:hypothetical protein [Sulfurospirillaceae bacterium]
MTRYITIFFIFISFSHGYEFSNSSVFNDIYSLYINMLIILAPIVSILSLFRH